MTFFPPQYITKKDSDQSNAWWSLANAVYCILSPYLGYIVFPCEVGCQDEASEPIWVSRPAFSCQAHLDCFTCAGDPVVQCVKRLAESKKSGVKHWCVRKRLARCRTYTHRMREALQCQEMVVWRAFGAMLTLLVVTYSAIMNTEHRHTSEWIFHC